jgi:hypothetical protein
MHTPILPEPWKCMTIPYSRKAVGTEMLNVGEPAGKRLERVKGIEPSSQAWEARILPLNHTRVPTW